MTFTAKTTHIKLTTCYVPQCCWVIFTFDSNYINPTQTQITEYLLGPYDLQNL